MIQISECWINNALKTLQLDLQKFLLIGYVNAMVFYLDLIIIVVIALVLDLVFGELPVKIHPVVWMGNLIDFFKGYLIGYRNKSSGMILTFAVVLIFTLATYVLLYLIAFNYLVYIFISALILSTTFAIKTLLSAVEGIEADISVDIVKARKSMSYLVSRNTDELSSEEIVSAAIETLTENITDSIIAPLFYTYIFSLPGAVAYRVVNTLDAMVGYKNPENIEIGWFPAKTDDILNYIPARVTGIFIVLAAALLGLRWKSAYIIMMRDARNPDSPNSGFPMAAAAGALGIKLKKIGHYEIGDDINPLSPDVIFEAVAISKLTAALFLIFITIFYVLILFVLLQTF